jgi:hypothetical protein
MWAIRQVLFSKIGVKFCEQKIRAQNVDEIDPSSKNKYRPIENV